MNKQEIHIIGAGFAGLSTAYYLSKLNKFNITIFEKNNRTGGMIYTHKNEKFIAEEAASSILLNDQVIALLNEIQAPYVKPFPEAKKRFFFFKKMTRWPLNLFESIFFVTKVIHSFLVGKFNQVLKNQSLAEWLEERIGQIATHRIVSPALQGIYAAPATDLNAQLLINMTKSKKGKKYQGIVCGKSGMSDIIEALERACVNNSVEIKLNQEYKLERLDDNIIRIFCTRAYETADIIQSHFPKLAEQLNQIQYLDISAVTADCSVKPKKFKGFGCVVAKNNNINCLGILFNSDTFPNRYSASNETYIFGPDLAKTVEQESDSQLKNRLIEYRKKLFHFTSEQTNSITQLHKKYWGRGLPLYNGDLLNFQKNLVLPKNVYLNGNYIKGIGLSYIVNNSYELSRSLERKY